MAGPHSRTGDPIVNAMARGDVLQIVVFAVLFAIALAGVGSRGEPVLDLLRSLMKVMYRFTGYVMAVAPLGVLGATAVVVAQQGISAMAVFARVALAVGIGLASLLLFVFPAIAVLFRIPLVRLVGAVKDAAGVAFATSSSAAALPDAMAKLEECLATTAVARWDEPDEVALEPTGAPHAPEGATQPVSACEPAAQM